MLKKISITFFSKLINAGLGFLNTILITQYLGAAGKGATTLFMTSLTLCLLFCQVVGGNAMVYLSSRLPVSLLLLASSAWAIVISTVLTAILFLIGICPAELVAELAVVSILFALFHTHLFILLGKDQSVLFNLLHPFPQLMQLIAGIILFIILQIHNVNTYINNLYFIFSVSYIISLIFILPKLEPFKMPDKKTFLMIWNYGSKAQVSNILFFFNNRLFFYLIGYCFIKTEVGVYSTGIMIIEAILLIGNSFSLMLYSKISTTSSQAVQVFLTKRYALLSFGLTLFALCLATCIPADVYMAVFGTDFYPVKLIVLYLFPGALLMSIYYVTSSYFSGTGNYQYNNYAIVSGLIITIVCGFLFVPSGDIFTAASVTSAAFSLITLCSLFQFIRELKKLKRSSA